MRFAAILLVGLLISGCETTKYVLGTSTKEAVASRANATVKVFNMPYDKCFAKVRDSLKAIKVFVYDREPGFFACYRTSTDTTPVGVFVKPIDEKNTQVEVGSPSFSIQDEISRKLFSAIESE